MEHLNLPSLNGEDFRKNRNSLQSITQILSEISGELIPHQKNWEEFSLKFYSKGLTTSTIPVVNNGVIELLDLKLNLEDFQIELVKNNQTEILSLTNNLRSEFIINFKSALEKLGIQNINIDWKKFEDAELNFDPNELNNTWMILRYLYSAFLEFKGELLEETSSIQLWPHHFDLGMLLFTGRIIPDQDPNNWDYSRGQMNFGFSFGDGETGEPYIYITIYPFQEKLLETELPADAYWHTEGWNGAVIKYNSLVKNFNDKTALLNFFNFVKTEFFELLN